MYLPQASVENEYREPPKTCLPHLSSQDQEKTLDQRIYVLYHISGQVVSLDT
jgi:hypothetical protein